MKITAAFVLRGEINEIEEIENFINGLSTTIVYQKSSPAKLFISEEKP